MIDDYTATRYYNELETASGADKERMLRDLSEYADYRDKEEAKVNEEHFEKLYTDPAYFGQFANSDSMRQAEDASLNPSDTRYEVANRAYLNYLTGNETDSVDYEATRDAYAREHFGKPEIGEKDFFESVKGRIRVSPKEAHCGSGPLYAGGQACAR